jgi:hypothetical protein
MIDLGDDIVDVLDMRTLTAGEERHLITALRKIISELADAVPME